jgi:hypothetical protein
MGTPRGRYYDVSDVPFIIFGIGVGADLCVRPD